MLVLSFQKMFALLSLLFKSQLSRAFSRTCCICLAEGSRQWKKKPHVVVFCKGFQRKFPQNLPQLTERNQSYYSCRKSPSIYCIRGSPSILSSPLMPWHGFDINLVISWSDSLHFTCSSNVNSKENMKYRPDMEKWQHTASKSDVASWGALFWPAVVYFIHHPDKRHLPEHLLRRFGSRGAPKVKALASLPK